jgi:ribosomal protein L23
MTVQGKERRRRNGRGFDPQRKKAIVTLAAGQQITRLFETSSG